jgi:malate dehydrogenase (oxaloacetate-decarboxylating)(NADP+)
VTCRWPTARAWHSGAEAIAENEDLAYDYTAKGNTVAVISNGTAILGLGDLGPMASKPVMEGKSVLFKRFADIDSFDVEVNRRRMSDEFCTSPFAILVRHGVASTLEDIGSRRNASSLKAACAKSSTFRSSMTTSTARPSSPQLGIINACHITGRELKDLKVAVSGAGAAGLSVAGLIRHLGVKAENILMCDSTGVVYEGRTERMDQFKSAFAVKTNQADAGRSR